jgi:hypothetical protein
VHDARPLVNAITGRHQMLLVLIHEPGPALQHDDDVKIIGVTVPSGAFLRRLLRAHQLGDDPAAGRFGYPQTPFF